MLGMLIESHIKAERNTNNPLERAKRLEQIERLQVMRVEVDLKSNDAVFIVTTSI